MQRKDEWTVPDGWKHVEEIRPPVFFPPSPPSPSIPCNNPQDCPCQCFVTFVFSFNRISLFRASRIFSRRVWNIQLMLHSRKDNIWGLYLITAISKHLSLKHCSHGWFLIAMAFLESKDEKQTMRNLSKTSTFGETYTSWNQRMSNKQTMRNLSKKNIHFWETYT